MDQNTLILVIVAVVLAIALFGWLFAQRKKTDHLRDQYGDEYDRTLEASPSRAKAEHDLAEREKRVKSYDIRRLTPDEHDRFTREWTDAKALFVDSPVEAIGKSDRLLSDVMQTRGYPMADFDQQHADLTVEHGDVAKHYLAGHETFKRSGEATTEEMRRAFNHYEKLFQKLVSDAGNVQDQASMQDRAVAPPPQTDRRTDDRAYDDRGYDDRADNRDRTGLTGDRDRDGVPNAVDPDDNATGTRVDVDRNSEPVRPRDV